MGFNHLSSTALQNKTTLVQLPVINISKISKIMLELVRVSINNFMIISGYFFCLTYGRRFWPSLVMVTNVSNLYNQPNENPDVITNFSWFSLLSTANEIPVQAWIFFFSGFNFTTAFEISCVNNCDDQSLIHTSSDVCLLSFFRQNVAHWKNAKQITPIWNVFVLKKKFLIPSTKLIVQTF